MKALLHVSAIIYKYIKGISTPKDAYSVVV